MTVGVAVSYFSGDRVSVGVTIAPVYHVLTHGIVAGVGHSTHSKSVRGAFVDSRGTDQRDAGFYIVNDQTQSARFDMRAVVIDQIHGDRGSELAVVVAMRHVAGDCVGVGAAITPVNDVISDGDSSRISHVSQRERICGALVGTRLTTQRDRWVRQLNTEHAFIVVAW